MNSYLQTVAWATYQCHLQMETSWHLENWIL